MGLYLPRDLTPVYAGNAFQVDDRRHLFDLGSIGRLLPGQWERKQIDFQVRNTLLPLLPFDAELVIFTTNKPVSKPFTLDYALHSRFGSFFTLSQAWSPRRGIT